MGYTSQYAQDALSKSSGSDDDDKKKPKKKGTEKSTEPKLSWKDKRQANKNRKNKTINANIPDYRNYKED